MERDPRVIWETTYNNNLRSYRVVKQRGPVDYEYYHERSEKLDAMGNPVWEYTTLMPTEVASILIQKLEQTPAKPVDNGAIAQLVLDEFNAYLDTRTWADVNPKDLSALVVMVARKIEAGNIKSSENWFDKGPLDKEPDQEN